MNWEDFRRNFAQSYFGLQPSVLKSLMVDHQWNELDLSAEKPLIPCTCPSFGTNKSQVSVTCVFKTRSGSAYQNQYIIPFKDDIDEDPNFMVGAHPPRLGMVQSKETFSFIRRPAQRQYNRGYSARSCTSWVPNLYTVQKEGLSVHPGDLHTVWHVYNPYVKTFPEALDILEAGEKIGVVLAPSLGVYIEIGRKYPRLAYRNDTVGFVINGEPVVYSSVSEVARDYILKITGIFPKVKG
jgi:hypothetical protein